MVVYTTLQPYCIIKFCYSNIIQKLGLLKSVLRCQQKLGAKIKCRTITQIITKYLSFLTVKPFIAVRLCYYRVGNISINEIWIHIGIYLVEAFCHFFTQFPCRKERKSHLQILPPFNYITEHYNSITLNC